jgi:hypothetical protein
VTEKEDAARNETLAKLAQSREELRRLLDPPRKESAENGSAQRGAFDEFPRSRTMQMLMDGRVLSTLGAVASGLLIARPGLALRLLRMLPASAVARGLIVKAFTALRARH